MRRGLFLFAVLLNTGLLGGCGTLPNGRQWGHDATLFPGWDRIRQAATSAAFAPETWVPVVGAAVVTVGEIDENLADWAADHKPVFGSQTGAEGASDRLRDATAAAYLITALATPSGDESKEWLVAKLKGIAVGTAAASLTYKVTDFLKDQTERTRPDGSDNRSFPSAHASIAASFATLASRNLNSLPLTHRTRCLLRVSFISLAAGTAWGRVEAKRHYPSDVLAGYAVGHFLSAFINDAFLGVDRLEDAWFALATSKQGITLSVYWAF